MPTLFNVDHQYALVRGGDVAVAPGESHDFTNEEIEAGLTGVWSKSDPRAGLAAEKKFKAKRSASTSTAADDSEPMTAGAEKENTE